MDLLTLKNVEQRLLREYLDLPGLTLSLSQTARLLRVDASTCQLVLNHLVDAQYLAYGESGMYVRGARDGDLELWKTLVKNRLAVLAQRLDADRQERTGPATKGQRSRARQHTYSTHRVPASPGSLASASPKSRRSPR